MAGPSTEDRYPTGNFVYIKAGLCIDGPGQPEVWHTQFIMSGLALGGEGVTLISQGTGYGLLIGLGVAFCGVIVVAVKIQRAYLAEDSATSEMFMVANRSVGTGLTASAVFSSWMWINETVMASAMCFRYGLAVPMVSFRLWAPAAKQR